MNDAVHDTPVSHALDTRQRSMLEAMGIQLWQTPASLEAETQRQPVLPETAVFEQNRPSPLIKSTQTATKNIANSSDPTAMATEQQRATPPTPRPEGVEQMSWSALQNAVSTCQACLLCQARKKTVFGVGPVTTQESQVPQVDWLIVGEAPGEQEDIAGEPFVGPAGQLLDNMLAAMKISLHGQGKPVDLSRTKGSYIANVLKCRPPANRNPSPEEVAMCEPYLARQIELLRPKIILAMGKFAISSLTGNTEAVGKLRGRVHALKHPSYQAPVIVTYHPAYLLRNLPDKAKAWADLILAMQTYLTLESEPTAR